MSPCDILLQRMVNFDTKLRFYLPPLEPLHLIHVLNKSRYWKIFIGPQERVNHRDLEPQ